MYYNEEAISIIFADVQIEQLKIYIEVVKLAGFNIDSTTTEIDLGDYPYYVYTAKNSLGSRVEIFTSSGTMGINIYEDKL